MGGTRAANRHFEIRVLDEENGRPVAVRMQVKDQQGRPPRIGRAVAGRQIFTDPYTPTQDRNFFSAIAGNGATTVDSDFRPLL